MGRPLCEYFKIGDSALPEPDFNGGIAFNFEDIDSSDTGRDASGVMKRNRIREKVAKWNFKYGYLTEEDYKTVMGIVLNCPQQFTFTHPHKTDPYEFVEVNGKTVKVTNTQQSTCYLSKVNAGWYSNRLGIYKDVSFNVIEY